MDDDDGDTPVDSIDTTAYLVCSVVLLIIGTTGNCLLLMSVLMVKKLRTLNNALIFNLVVADSLALVLLDVLGISSIVSDADSPLANDTRLCKVVSFFTLSASICSVWSVASCCLHVYTRVCHKALFQVVYTPQVVIVMIFWLWTLCPMIVIPSMMGWGGHGFDNRLKHCAYDPTASTSFTYFMLTLGVWVPLGIAIYCLVRIFVVLRGRVGDVIEPQVPEIHVWDGEEDRPPPQICNNMKTTWSVMSVFAVTLVSWLTLSIIWILGQRRSFGDAQFLFAMILAQSPNCLNSIVYALSNEDFRKAYIYMVTFNRVFSGHFGTEPAEPERPLSNGKSYSILKYRPI